MKQLHFTGDKFDGVLNIAIWDWNGLDFNHSSVLLRFVCFIWIQLVIE